MSWSLWLDDQINDPATPERHVPSGFIGAESSQTAIALVEERGTPERMSLDFDLGDGDSCEVFLKWLAENYPEPPEYVVHSRNVVGAAWIKSFMDSWKRSIAL